MSLQICFSDVPLPLSIPSSIDLEAGESNAKNLVIGLSFLDPSQKCQESITPFLCIFIFNLCDSSNTLHTIMRKDCFHIRDNVCVSEWRQARQFLGDEVLPVCEDLPDITEDCLLTGIAIRGGFWLGGQLFKSHYFMLHIHCKSELLF